MNKPGKDLHLSTADHLKVGFHPWLNIRPARWLRFESAPTAGVNCDPDEMVWMCQQLKAAKGEDFSVTCPPHPSLSDHPIDAAITSALADAGVLDYAGPQFYDWDGFSPSVIFDLVGQWVAHFGGDESKVAVGFGANYNPGFYTSLTPEVVASTWASIKAAYPGIHRAFGWSAQTDMDAGGSFGRTMRPRL